MKYIENPLLSVVIPVYNVEEYLRECLNSVINQTYRNLEIILINDGSTDNSSLICDEFVRMDNRVRVIHQENMGLVAARKIGISSATGDIATFVDSDDWLDLNMYKIMVREMIDSGADIVSSGLIREYGKHSIHDVEGIQPGTYSGKELDDIVKNNLVDESRFFKSNVSMHIYNKLYNKELLMKNELLVPNNINVGEDAACVYPCILDANTIVFVDQCFYHYRIRNNSIMGQSNIAEVIRLKELYQYLYQRFNNYPNSFILITQLRQIMIYSILLVSPQQLIDEKRSYLSYYPQVKKGTRIIVYGAGRAGKALVRALKDREDYKIVGWIDKNDSKIDFIQIEYDFIIIAVYLYSAYEEIYNNLINMGISKDKIVSLELREIIEGDDFLKIFN